MILTLCLLISMLAFGNSGQAHAAALPDAATTAQTLGGSFGTALVPLIGNGFLAGIDSSGVIIFMSVASLTFEAADEMNVRGLEGLSGYSFGIFENRYISVLLLVWFGLPTLLKAFSKTNALGLTLESQFGKFNGVIDCVIAASQLIANVPTQVTTQAASVSPGVSESVTQGISAFVCFILLTCTMLVYFLMRYLFLFADIALLPACTFIPFCSLGIVVAKFLAITGLLIMAAYLPYLFFIIFVLTLILAVILFKSAYIAVRYFKNIYVKPFFKGLVGYKKDIPLVSPRLPKAVRSFASDVSADIAVPVYLLRRIPGQEATHKYDRWWFISAPGGQYLCKSVFMRNTCRSITLLHSDTQKIFINQSLRFFEIFTLAGPESDIIKTFHRIPKHLHLAFSREYRYRFDDLKSLSHFTDYTEHRNYLKQTLKESRQRERGRKSFGKWFRKGQA